MLDFIAPAVLSMAPDGTDVRSEAHVSSKPAGLGWLPDGRLLILLGNEATVVRREHDGTFAVHARLGDDDARYNEMVVDPVGRAYIGRFDLDAAGEVVVGPGALVCASPDGSVREVADELWFPNGAVITAQGHLLVGESFANRVTAFVLGSDGSLRDRWVWAKFGPMPTSRTFRDLMSEANVVPDGCCLDAQGALWLADAAGRRVIRVLAGRIVEELRFDQATFACGLGGGDGRTLFVCLAPAWMRPEDRLAGRQARVVATRVSVPAVSAATAP
ncbi:SMP-30/gluconolactonase/LRE family protein [Dactylosporangium sp. CA-092794]|uniref:SMP-30/gluconolactonase/LRE family protein n=1 Tax=Dactylosporangium sp. CA-092794 TaxID=3239929 RepID=UPI003D8B33FE